jgi:hypothetical protein
LCLFFRIHASFKLSSAVEFSVPTVVGFGTGRQSCEIIGMCFGDESVSNIVLVILCIVVLVNLGLLLEEGAETALPSAFSRTTLEIARKRLDLECCGKQLVDAGMV